MFMFMCVIIIIIIVQRSISVAPAKEQHVTSNHEHVTDTSAHTETPRPAVTVTHHESARRVTDTLNSFRKPISAVTPMNLEFRNAERMTPSTPVNLDCSFLLGGPPLTADPVDVAVSETERIEAQAVTAGGRKPKRSLEEFEKMKEMIRNKRQNVSSEPV